MNSLSVNARVDLQNQGFPDIRIAVFSPGLVATEFGLNAVRCPHVMPRPVDLAAGVDRRSSRPLPRGGASSARAAAARSQVHGGPDNRQLPGAQPVDEVAALIAQMIAHPDQGVDVYSRPAYKDTVAAWCVDWGGKQD